MPWKQIMELALAITVVAGVGVGAVLGDAWRVDRDFHAAWLSPSGPGIRRCKPDR